MARRYSVVGDVTNTQSSTLPLLCVIATTAIRPKIYDVVVGSAATPADNACSYSFQRQTTTGTAGSSFTPVALDPGDPASTATAGLAVYSVGPTLTASSFPLRFAVNQRATFRWVAAPGGELIIPATASNGLALMALTTTTAATVSLCVHFEE